MILHHLNAVNISKSLLKINILNDYNLTMVPEITSWTLQKMVMGISNIQVFQIQLMGTMSQDMGIPLKNDCTVLMNDIKYKKNNPKLTKPTNKRLIEVHKTRPK